MSASNLRLDNDRVLEASRELGQALSAYRAFGGDPLANQIAALDEMNSSFTSKVSHILVSMGRDNPNYLGILENINRSATQVARNLRQMDSEMASGKGGNN